MKAAIIGYGEIGQAVHQVIGQAYPIDKEPVDLPKMDILHICFPYSETFIKDVKNYIKQYKPWHVVIWSTVPIGTTKQIKGAVHSPVEGRHPNLVSSIKNSVRWLGYNDKEEGLFFKKYFEERFINTRAINSSDFTEFLKLRSTAKYGINIVWTDYEASVAKQIGMDFELVKDFDRDYNKLYHNLDMPQFKRYILDPPKGKISGHCILPNAEILDEQFPHELLKQIKGMK